MRDDDNYSVMSDLSSVLQSFNLPCQQHNYGQIYVNQNLPLKQKRLEYFKVWQLAETASLKVQSIDENKIVFVRQLTESARTLISFSIPLKLVGSPNSTFTSDTKGIYPALLVDAKYQLLIDQKKAWNLVNLTNNSSKETLGRLSKGLFTMWGIRPAISTRFDLQRVADLAIDLHLNAKTTVERESEFISGELERHCAT